MDKDTHCDLVCRCALATTKLPYWLQYKYKLRCSNRHRATLIQASYAYIQDGPDF